MDRIAQLEAQVSDRVLAALSGFCQKKTPTFGWKIDLLTSLLYQYPVTGMMLKKQLFFFWNG